MVHIIIHKFLKIHFYLMDVIPDESHRDVRFDLESSAMPWMDMALNLSLYRFLWPNLVMSGKYMIILSPSLAVHSGSWIIFRIHAKNFQDDVGMFMGKVEKKLPHNRAFSVILYHSLVSYKTIIEWGSNLIKQCKNNLHPAIPNRVRYGV